MSFSSLGLNQDLINAVTEQGYTEPTPIQAQAIPAILNQQDIMAGAQTGTGKTAAFALPILHLLSQNRPVNTPVRALVLTPTRELAQQVYQSFVNYGKHSQLQTVITYGGVSINRQVEALKQGADIVVATPGRLLDHLHTGAISLDQLQYLVFDEADRMLDMGFMGEIKRILKVLPEQRQTLLFSATFDEAIIKLSQRLLKDPELIEVDERNTAADKVEQKIYVVDKDRKRELVSHLIGAKNWQQVLIFTRTKQGADNLANQMCKDGIKTQSIHGDKSQGARQRALEEFKSGKTRALIATDVASRGLDINQLQYVINYELPFNPEDYIHRIGRTGRAGSTGLAISLLSPDENQLLEDIEKVLDARLPQQWLEGYEPDLTKDFGKQRTNAKAAHKRKENRQNNKKRSGSRTGGRQR